MDVYTRIIIESIGFIVFVILLWLILAKTRNNRRLTMRDASLSGSELEDHARKTALGHSVSSRQNYLNWPIPKMNDQYEYIQTVYKGLNDDIRKKRNVPPAAEWLLDNFYIIEEQIKGLRRDFDRKLYTRLPVLSTGPLKGTARIVAVAEELVAHTDGQMDETVISNYLKAYQSHSHSVLMDREIWALPMVLRLALIENIRLLSETIRNTQFQWHKADNLIDDWLEHAETEPERVTKLFRDCLKSADEANPSFIEHLFYRLRRSGLSYSHLLRIIDENLSKFGTTTERVTQMEHNAQSVYTVSMGNSITSLHHLATLDWSDLFESASAIEQILNQDPDGTYPLMDLQTRNYYRSQVEKIASLHGVSEIHIAKEVVALAKEARNNDQMISDESKDNDNTDPVDKRTWHVGYYLMDKGIEKLETRQGKKNRIRRLAVGINRKSAGILYLGSIGLVSLLLVAVAVWYAIISTAPGSIFLWLLAGFAVLIPASEIAVNVVNWIVCRILKPAVFPRLELKNGIPEEMSTIVIIPTLLPDAGRVKELLSAMEGHYLSNRDKNLFFTLTGGFMDSDLPVPQDMSIINAAISGVHELNLKYAEPGLDKFYFFHRSSQFNEQHNKWIGWERKRGALMEFNELVLGSKETSFTYASNKNPPFSKVRYIITLDSDTILPIGMAKKMISTMAHPLNRPVIDRKRGVVVKGYGLMQPRVDVEVASSNRSMFSRIMTGQEGLDPYANAISDVYQDLFGEGIYTGKGIYDLSTFNEVLKTAVPDNSILSHDLMEGSYVRTGLVTDLKLVDNHPSRYNAYAARLHRWVRGDWQLFPLLFRKVVNLLLKRIDNPLSLLSRWKIFDNLRRSLVAPSLIILATLGFCVLPGSLFVWLGFFFLAQAFSFILAVVGYLFSGHVGSGGIKRYMPVMVGI